MVPVNIMTDYSFRQKKEKENKKKNKRKKITQVSLSSRDEQVEQDHAK